MSSERQVTNGVDVGQLTETIETVSESPGVGQFRFYAETGTEALRSVTSNDTHSAAVWNPIAVSGMALLTMISQAFQTLLHTGYVSVTNQLARGLSHCCSHPDRFPRHNSM